MRYILFDEPILLNLASLVILFLQFIYCLLNLRKYFNFYLVGCKAMD